MSVREPFVEPSVTGQDRADPDAPASQSGVDAPASQSGVDAPASQSGTVDPVLVPGSRLNLLASAVRNGTYRVDPFDVADSMLPYVRVFA